MTHKLSEPTIRTADIAHAAASAAPAASSNAIRKQSREQKKLKRFLRRYSRFEGQGVVDSAGKTGPPRNFRVNSAQIGDRERVRELAHEIEGGRARAECGVLTCGERRA